MQDRIELNTDISLEMLKKKMPYFLDDAEMVMAEKWEPKVVDLVFSGKPLNAKQRVFLKVISGKAVSVSKFQLLWRKITDARNLMAYWNKINENYSKANDSMKTEIAELRERINDLNEDQKKLSRELVGLNSQKNKLFAAFEDPWKSVVKSGSTYEPPDLLKDRWDNFLIEQYRRGEVDCNLYLKWIFLWSPALFSLREIRELLLENDISEDVRELMEAHLLRFKYFEDPPKFFL